MEGGDDDDEDAVVEGRFSVGATGGFLGVTIEEEEEEPEEGGTGLVGVIEGLACMGLEGVEGDSVLVTVFEKEEAMVWGW